MYEIYVQKFQITEWKDGAIYKTVSLGCGWFAEDVVRDNKSRDTNVMYVSASDDYARSNSTIRRIKTPQYQKPENNVGRRQDPS